MKPNYKEFGKEVASILNSVSTDDEVNIEAIYKAAERWNIPIHHDNTDD